MRGCVIIVRSAARPSIPVRASRVYGGADPVTSAASGDRVRPRASRAPLHSAGQARRYPARHRAARRIASRGRAVRAQAPALDSSRARSRAGGSHAARVDRRQRDPAARRAGADRGRSVGGRPEGQLRRPAGRGARSCRNQAGDRRRSEGARERRGDRAALRSERGAQHPARRRVDQEPALAVGILRAGTATSRSTSGWSRCRRRSGTTCCCTN